ncbi:MAG: hypothetical protein KJP14_09940 [Eudoraea sp.]|nr:hypothetical protein [Eudoraea sp.]MBT8210836.1 hypothetical protein [Eudoraea sp.]NNK29378.1 hypothetical protein [Flavobacteriaceae bacterium]
MKTQFCKIGATNSHTQKGNTNISMLNQYQIFLRRALEYRGKPLQKFFELKARKIKRILESRRG